MSLGLSSLRHWSIKAWTTMLKTSTSSADTASSQSALLTSRRLWGMSGLRRTSDFSLKRDGSRLKTNSSLLSCYQWNSWNSRMKIWLQIKNRCKKYWMNQECLPSWPSSRRHSRLWRLRALTSKHRVVTSSLRLTTEGHSSANHNSKRILRLLRRRSLNPNGRTSLT